MPIKTLILQRRLTEVGRIRIGQIIITARGKQAPSKLDRFRVTSADRMVLDRIAALYGGEVKEWTPLGGVPGQYEVVTDANSIPVIVPPQPLTQWMEHWSGGGVQRRCDGEVEMRTGVDCICAANDEMICKPTTRLSVMLRDVESIGVFRLESKGWNAAAELPGMAELLAQAGGYVTARLYLKPVRQVSDGKTKDFMVPALAVDGLTPAQLLSGGGAIADANGVVAAPVAAPAVASAGRAAIGAGPSAAPTASPPRVNGSAAPVAVVPDGRAQSLADKAVTASSPDALREVWNEAKAAGLLAVVVTVGDASGELGALIQDLGKHRTAPAPEAADPTSGGTAPAASPSVTPGRVAPTTATAAPSPAVERAWTACMAAAGQLGWTTTELERDFASCHGGKTAAQVHVDELRAYVADLERRADRAAGDPGPDDAGEVVDAELVLTGEMPDHDPNHIPF